jgi:hypothetical protein
MSFYTGIPGMMNENSQIQIMNISILQQQREIEQIKKENAYLKSENEKFTRLMSYNDDIFKLCRSLENEKKELLTELDAKNQVINEMKEMKEKHTQYLDCIIDLQQNIGVLEAEIQKFNQDNDLLGELKMKIKEQDDMIVVLKEKNETNAKTIFKMADDNKKQNAIIIELRETIDNKIKGNKDIVGKINEIRKIDAFYSKCLIIILQQTILQLKYGGEFIYMLNMINSNNNKVEGVFNMLKPILLEYFYNYLPGINLNLK